ncbi:PhzF family phenazine biosynthesis protein [Paenibacillus sp. NEAU-GSW1]|uniref:PhzF family phenazine biosynthesis protein n=1 Tax=Paenibacillus sp. NEAU-GSW1 TaxID=2682486 RepID=UPI0012E1D5F7|nr:PhzF family phenazine biosynthesis protein [Paenibacillus sp. NEAU-GSW1]MUT66555.1 PhzF family phenazine biosynthesis isomerase [Paenibacillus sp. NEAU-GSW1]
MESVKVYHYDSFSPVPHKGNPAGVVFNGAQLSEEQMLDIANKVGFNETAFPLPSDKADLRIRFFTPGHEINLCGHATVATVYALATKGLLDDKTDITIETKAGVLPIRIDKADGVFFITMRQAAPEFRPFNGSLRELAESIGLEEHDIDDQLPTLYGSTGTWTLLVPIKRLEAFNRMKPASQRFPDVLEEMPRASVHPFCLETYDPSAHMHARHFSSPFSGTTEDPVTGTASGVMGAYYNRYIYQRTDYQLSLIVEQGQEIGRDGRVHVTVTNGNIIEISGHCVHVNDFDVSL